MLWKTAPLRSPAEAATDPREQVPTEGLFHPLQTQFFLVHALREQEEPEGFECGGACRGREQAQCDPSRRLNPFPGPLVCGDPGANAENCDPRAAIEIHLSLRDCPEVPGGHPESGSRTESQEKENPSEEGEPRPVRSSCSRGRRRIRSSSPAPQGSTRITGAAVSRSSSRADRKARIPQRIRVNSIHPIRIAPPAKGRRMSNRAHWNSIRLCPLRRFRGCGSPGVFG